MTEKIISYGIVSLAVGLTIRYLQKGTTIAVTATGNGQFFLRMHRLYGIAGTIGILFGLFLTTMIIVTNAPILVAVITFLVSVGTGLPCLVYYKNHYVKFDSQVIEVKSFWGTQRLVSWKDINDISFSGFSQLLTITDNNGNKIKIHQHLVGFSTFIKTMEEKTNWTADQLRIPIKR